MTFQQPSILVGCDGSAASATAVAWAVEHARATGGSLRLLAAWEWPTFQGVPVTYGQWGPDRDCRSRLVRLRASIDLPADRVSLTVERGNPSHVLVEQAQEADLLVVGTHGMGAVSRLVLGSASAYCAHHSPVPVAIVRRNDAGARAVLVGVDDSECARSALRWAMDYADLVNERLRVVHVVETPALPVAPGVPIAVTYPKAALHRDARQWLRKLVAKSEADRGRPVAAGVSYRVVGGSTAHVLVSESKRAALTVVGRRGAGGIHRLVVGSVAAALAHNGHATVVLTPNS
jgi:nucleotide-binding universal stress UspA family protein